MSNVNAEKSYNSFIRGIITEASPLTYPENASLDEDNFVLRRDGARYRRLGIDYETGAVLKDSGYAPTILQSTKQSFHRWDNPGGDTTISIGIIRIYDKLWFIDTLSTTPTANFLNNGNPITISGLTNADIETTTILNDVVLVSSDLSLPILLMYDKTTKLVSQQTITLKVRDIWGVDDSLADLDRPATLSNSHKYNLRNQGWSTRVVSTCGTDAIDCTFSTLAVYPSNADIWTLGKIGNVASANFEKYDPNSLTKNSMSNAPAAKGFYILDAFTRGASRNTLSGLSGLATDQEVGKLSTVATYAGRVFYSGISSSITGRDNKSPNYSGYLLFSQTITGRDKLGFCYQEADPTSPEISDLIDTDGGTIQIPEISKIIKLLATQTSLLVFAENGVWEIFGDQGGFTATSIQVAKVSPIGVVNAKSIVDANGLIFYFTKAGIFVLSQDPTSLRYKAENISLSTIQSLYENFSTLTKSNVKGFFDEKENKVRWLYNDLPYYSTTSYINRYNRELIFDVQLKAFYLHSISSLTENTPFVCDYIALPGYAITTQAEDVYTDGEQVLVNSESVVVSTDSLSGRNAPFAFLILRAPYFTIGEYINTSFKDWKTVDGIGINYTSYLITGYEIFGDIARYKQVPYAVFYFNKTENGFKQNGTLEVKNPSGCTVQAQWNWTNTATGGKWGTEFQAYRFIRNYIPSGVLDTFDTGDKIIMTKNKLRGTGKALSLKIQSVEGKDMQLLGWYLKVTGDGVI